MNQKGVLLVNYIYDEILVGSIENRSKGNQAFIIVKDGKYGFLGKDLDEFIPPRYYKAEHFNSRGLAKVWADSDFWGYIDETGREYFEKKP